MAGNSINQACFVNHFEVQKGRIEGRLCSLKALAQISTGVHFLTDYNFETICQIQWLISEQVDALREDFEDMV